MENEKELKQKIERLKELGCKITLQDLSYHGRNQAIGDIPDKMNYDNLLLNPEDNTKLTLDKINTKIAYLENRPWIQIVKRLTNTSINICHSCVNYDFNIKHLYELSQKYIYERKQSCDKNHFKDITGDDIPITICKDYD